MTGADYTRVQAVSVVKNKGVFWGLQYHPEYDLHEMARLIYCRKEKLQKRGFFQDTDAAQEYVDLLECLYQDPTRRDIAWRLGVDDDIMNKDVRQAEVKNWIEQLVIPSKAG